MQALSMMFKLIDRNDCCGLTRSRYAIVLRLPLLFASAGIVAGLWWSDVKPKIERLWCARHCLLLIRVKCERINVHEMAVEFVFSCQRDNESGQFIATDDPHQGNDRFYWSGPIITRFCDLTLMKSKTEVVVAAQREVEKERSKQLRKILTPGKILKYVNHVCHTSSTFCIFDFWQTEAWWQQQILTVQPAWIFQIEGHCQPDQAKSARLLNHLTRVLLQHHPVATLAHALTILKRMPVEKIELLKCLYVEPIAGSLFASCISTIFMHNKQQHGLNTKHAATKGGSGNDAIDKIDNHQLRSHRSFDSKIYLDMCASCDKREIFEIMLRINLKVHRRNAAQYLAQFDSDAARSSLKCLCKTCCTLRDLANAWQYFDCNEAVWLRLEFNRRFYAKVCALLEPLVLQRESDTCIVYTSYKNELTCRDKFVANFVNYYSFYENNEQPLTMDKCHGKIRQMVSTIFLFGNINWTLIEKAAAKGVPYNSISLNQQSLFKSLDNTLYSIFSENSIYRMSKETEQVTLSVNAPYVNRGLGVVPNCGINSFSAAIEFIFNDDQ